MLRKGPGSDYLVETHTLEHMRDEFYTPRLANRSKREALEAGDDALGRAKAFLAELRASPAETRLDPAVRKKVLARFGEVRPVARAAAGGGAAKEARSHE